MVRANIQQRSKYPAARTRWTAWAVLAGLLATPAVGRADDLLAKGESIYREQCAWCHGEAGEGVKDAYSRPLEGDLSVGRLAQLIDETMPEDDPGACVGEDAEAVAAYIHDAFYSPLAKARNKPARVEVSRLTVRQYRNAVADLLGSFREPGQPDGRRGLRAEYYKGRRFRDSERALERVDPEVSFDFGVGSPDSETFDPQQFSIRWEGTVEAPETGTYEFVVRTEHAARLWVNDLEQPLIDAWVRSGDDKEHRGSMALLGGRTYGLRLEFSKAKQGVDDKKKQKGPPPEVAASVALLWKPPGRVVEVVPARVLSPGRASEVFVLETAFPPDDRSVGYERGTSVSKAWDEATTEAAIEVAGYVADHLEGLASGRRAGSNRGGWAHNSSVPDFGVPDRRSDRSDDGAMREGRLRAFARRFAEQAFRRPLADEEARVYVDRQFEASASPEEAIKRVVLLALKSPRFLFLEIGAGPVDDFDVASRLSFELWDSLPDSELLEAAASGRLDDREDVEAQAARMVDDPRARSKVREFLLQWLKVDQSPDMAKDSALYPGFDEAIVADLRTSLELFLDDIAWGEGSGSDFRRLLLSDELYLNGRLARFYGGDLPPEAPFGKVAPAGDGPRAGILTHPYLLASFAYTSTSSPIHRGVFLARSVLGRSLLPPPEAFAPLAPDLHPSLTTRERVALQTSPAACINCHAMINPLGFALENFDAVGRFRLEEKGRAIDASGSYLSPSGEAVAFEGVGDLARFLAGSDEVSDAFAQQLFHYLVKQPILAFGMERPAALRRAFAEGNYSIRSLLVEIAAEAALAPRGGPELAAREPNP